MKGDLKFFSNNGTVKVGHILVEGELVEEEARLEITKGQNYITNYNKMFEASAEGCDSEEHS